MSPLTARKNIHPWALAVIGALVVTATICTLTLWIAISTHRGLIEEHPYEKGIDFDRVVQELSRGKTLALYRDFQIDLSSEMVTLVVSESARTIPDIKFTVVAIRPNDSNADHVVELLPNDEIPGSFIGSAKSFFPGLWLIEILADTPQGRARYRKRLMVE